MTFRYLLKLARPTILAPPRRISSEIARNPTRDKEHRLRQYQ
jgi:hypothetical protein